MIYQFRKWARRNKVAFAAGSAVAAALILVAAVSVFAAKRERYNSRQLKLSLTREHLRKGQALGDKGQLAQALHWMALSLEELPKGNPDLRKAIEDNLMAWIGQWVEPENLFFHDSAVLEAVFSPDGRRLLTGTLGGAITLIDVETGREEWVKRTGRDNVWAVAWSPEGTRFVAGFWAENVVQLFSADTGEPIGSPMGHDQAVYCAAFSPDGRHVLTGSYDGTGRVWSGETGVPITAPLQHDGIVFSVAFSPDSRLALTGSQDGTARLWSAETGEQKGTPLDHGGAIHRVAFSPGGEVIATGGIGPVSLWETKTGKSYGNALPHAVSGGDLCFSPDGTKLLTGGSDGFARLWSVKSGEPIAYPMRHEGLVVGASFSPDGNAVLTSSTDGTARLWSAETGKPVSLPLPNKTFPWIPMAAFSANGQMLLTRPDDPVIAFWPDKLRDPDVRHPEGISHPRAAEFLPDGRSFITCHLTGEVKLWSSDTGKALGLVLQHGGDVYDVTFSPDGKTLLSAGKDNAARLWDSRTGHTRGITLVHEGDIRAGVFGHDGKLIATGSDDGSAKIWSAVTGQQHGTTLPHGRFVYDVVFTPDGERLVTGCGDGRVRVWSVADGRVLRTLEDGGSVLAVDVSGGLIATGGMDRTAKLWDADSGESTGVVLSHDGNVHDVTFSPDGRWLLTTCDDNRARLWSVSAGEQVGPSVQHLCLSEGKGAFNKEGTRVVIAHVGGASIWRIAAPARETILNATKWIEVLTHRQMDEHGTLSWLDNDTWETRRQELERLGGPRMP